MVKLNCFIFLFISCTITINAKYVKPFSALDDKIVEELEKHKKDLAEGNWVFPPLDPYYVDDFSTSYQNKYANLNVSSKNMVVTGTTDYNKQNVQVSLDGLFELFTNEPLLHIEGEFESVGKIAAKVPVDGKGTYKCDVKNMEILSKGKLSTNKDGKLFLELLSFGFHVEQLDVVIKGLDGGSLYDQIVSAMVSDGAAAFINANVPLFDKFVSKFVRKYLDAVLVNYTPEELLDFINGLD